MSSLRRRVVVVVTALFVSVPTVLVVAAAPASAVAVPAGFTDVTASGGLGFPTGVARVPDGRTLVTDKSGILWMVNADASKTKLTTFPNLCTDSEMGLLSATPDPAFASNGWVYVYRTVNPGTGCVNRVSRFTISGASLDLGSELPLMTIPRIPSGSSVVGNHNGGDIKIGKDGLLYISSGDGGAGQSFHGQLLNTSLGKILRIGRDGSIPASNPFVGAGSARCNATGTTTSTYCQETVAFGLRNPYRIATDQNAAGTKLMINDVGEGTWEEIDQLTIGANYGWDQREGFCTLGQTNGCTGAPSGSGYTDPLSAYEHTATGCEAITGGAFVTNGTWGGGFDGTYLAADFVCGKIQLFTPAASGPWTRSVFADGVGGITDLTMAADLGGPALYYVTSANGGELHRITKDAAGTQGPPGAFTPLSPSRILDTRSDIGISTGKPSGGATITLQVTGTPGVPSDAIAVALNVTGADAAGPGFVTVWPARQTRPGTSSLNFTKANETVANAVLVQLGADGDLNLFTQKSANLIVDITGYWREATRAQAGRFEPVPTPTRLLDTREGNGAPKAIVGTGGSIDLQVTGRGGVPAAGVSAVAMVVTVTDSAAAGFVTAWPTGQPKPFASSLNPTGPNDIRSNLVIVPVGAGGKVSLFTQNATHLVADVTGWFSDSSAPASTRGLFESATPLRLLDTREPAGSATGLFTKLDTGETGILGYGPYVKPGAIAIVHNVTVDATVAAGFLTVYPRGNSLPLASNVNWNGAGQTRASLTLANLSSGSDVAYYAKVATHLIVDGEGWFTG